MGRSALTSLAKRHSPRIIGLLSSRADPGRRNDPVTAVLWVTVAMVCLAGLSGFGKYCAQQGIDPLQVAFFRNLFCLLLMLPLLAARGPELVRTENFSLYGVRIALALVAMWTWFHALALMPIGDLQATGFLAPLFATLFAIVYLGERVTAQRWMALGAGFLGAMVILRPWSEGLVLGQALALCAALATGITGPLIRQLTTKDDADKIVFITIMVLTPITLVPAVFVWQWPALDLWPSLVALGACAALGHLALTRALHSADASLVATFEFSRLPFAVLIGLVFFGETTSLWTWIGALIIFTAAISITRSETRARRGHLRLARDVSDPVGLTPLRLGLRLGDR